MKQINKATILKVIDGDTLVLLVNLGYNVYKEITIRLNRVDTPELRGGEREEGLKAKYFVEQYINKEVIVKSDGKKGKFGRWMCDIEINGKDLAELLIEKNLGKPYISKLKKIWLMLFD